MAKSNRKTKPALAVPQTDEEANVVFGRYGTHQLVLAHLETALAQETAVLKAKYEAEAEPLREALKLDFERLEAWAAANRKRLTDDGRTKSVDLPAGTIGWRINPPSVKTAGKIEAILETLKAMGLRRFIRFKPEINKERLIEERAKLKGRKIPGVTIVTDVEAFFAEPATLELSEPKT